MCSKKIDNKVRQLKELKRRSEDLATQIKNLETEIKDYMTERNVSELKGEDWVVTWNSFSSNRFNQSLFKEMHPDLYPEFMTLSESRRFTVK